MFRSAATKIAHNSTIPALGLAGNQDLRPLQELIAAEKAVIISLQRLSTDFHKASEALRAWGVGEGDDLGDVLNSSTIILNQFSTALSQYANLGHDMREQLKAIRTREENLDELRRRRRQVVSKAESAERKLSKMGPEHKNLPAQAELLNKLKDEIKMLDGEIMTEEASLGDFKRSTTRSWVGLKFGGLVECCEKGTIVAEYGRLLVGEIPEDTTQPGMPRRMYYGHPHTQRFVSEASRCISEVVLSSVPIQGARHSQLEESAYAPAGAPTTPPLSPISTGGRPSFGNLGQFPPPDYLGPPGGNQNEESTILAHSPFTVPMPEARPAPPSMAYSDSSQRQHDQEYPPRHPVDDFGVMAAVSGPIDQSKSGGRFATFPVKIRQGNETIGSTSGSVGIAGSGPMYGPGYNRDQPLSLSSRNDMEPSFSSSVAEALGGGKEYPMYPDGGNTAPPLPARDHFPSFGTQRLSPNFNQTGYARTPTPTSPPFPVPSTSPPGPPQHAKSGSLPQDMDNPWNQGQPPARTSSKGHNDRDGVLAYMLNEEDDAQSETSVSSSTKHVRFGQVSDIDHEMNERYEKAARGSKGQEDQDRDEKGKAKLASESQSGQSAQSSYSRSHRVPAPIFNPNESQRPNSDQPPSHDPPLYTESPDHPQTATWMNEKSQYTMAARDISKELEPQPYNAPTSPGSNQGVSPITPKASAWNQPSVPAAADASGYDSYPGTIGYAHYEHPQPSPRSRPSLSEVQFGATTPTTAKPPTSTDASQSHLQPPTSPQGPVTPAQAYAQAHSPYMSTSPSISTSSFQGRYDPPGAPTEGGVKAPAAGNRYDQGVTSPPAGTSPMSPGFNTAKMNSPLPRPPVEFEEPEHQEQPMSKEEDRPRRVSLNLPPPSPLYMPGMSSSPTALKPPAGVFGAPAFNRSNPSLNNAGAPSSPGPGGSPSIGGQKTISAAAFKKPPPRLRSVEAGLGVGTTPISPLSVKKKSPTLPATNFDSVREHEGYATLPVVPRGSPRADPYSTMGAEMRPASDHYDYINAYTDEPVGGEGYGQGRFATDLEHDPARARLR